MLAYMMVCAALASISLRVLSLIELSSASNMAGMPTMDDSMRALSSSLPPTGSSSSNTSTAPKDQTTPSAATVEKSSPSPPSSSLAPVEIGQRGKALCEAYDGILFISRVIRKAGAGTMFFQSLVDSLIYADKYNLYPYLWINDDENEPCYDPNVHGVGPNIAFTHLTGSIKDLVGKGKMECRTKHGTRPGPPDFSHLETSSYTLVGNGLWQSYFQPISPNPFTEPSCASKPIFEMTRTQIMPDMHRCSEFAVRGWAFKGIPDALLPNDRPVSDWLWDHRQRASWIVDKYFRVQPWLQQRINVANPDENSHCLAAHIRLTDKASGRDKKGLEAYRPYIEAYARATNEGAIYIATDDGTVIEVIRQTWSAQVSSRIISQGGAFRSTEENTPTFKLLAEDKHRSNTEALVEIYAMAKCSYFVHGYSGLAEATVYIHPKLHQRSVNIDDPDKMSPDEFEQHISVFRPNLHSESTQVKGTEIKSQRKASSEPGHDNPPVQIADGKFNGFDLYHVDNSPVSRIHCVGENYDSHRSYLYKSCEYSNLCFDVEKKRLVAFVDPPLDFPSDGKYVWKSSTQISDTSASVLAGTQPRTWFRDHVGKESYYQGVKRSMSDRQKRRAAVGRYRPKIYTDTESRPTSYYRLGHNVTLLPFYAHPTSYRNPGHIIWDEFLAYYTLLDIFGRVDDSLFLMQMIRPTVEKEGYEYFEEPLHDEEDNLMTKFLPLLVGSDMHSYSLNKLTLDFTKAHPRWKEGEPKIVCAEHGVMGHGLFSDHGEFNWHGQVKRDYENPHNYGRGGSLRRFRFWLLAHMGLSTTAIDKLPPRDPYLVIVSMNSSTRRGADFGNHTQALRDRLGPRADVQAVEFPSMGLSEQISLASRAAVIVSSVGGGSSTAFFLPKGASLYLFHNKNKRLDWDIWNNMPDIHVHWLPLKDRDRESSLEAFTDLVTRELDYLDKLHDQTLSIS